MGRQTALMAKVYRWEFGWDTNDDTVIVISVEIPDDVINIRGMLLGRDTISWNCWGLAFEKQGESTHTYRPQRAQYTYARQKEQK